MRHSPIKSPRSQDRRVSETAAAQRDALTGSDTRGHSRTRTARRRRFVGPTEAADRELRAQARAHRLIARKRRQHVGLDGRCCRPSGPAPEETFTTWPPPAARRPPTGRAQTAPSSRPEPGIGAGEHDDRRRRRDGTSDPGEAPVSPVIRAIVFPTPGRRRHARDVTVTRARSPHDAVDGAFRGFTVWLARCKTARDTRR